MYTASDLGPEDVIDEPVLLDPAAPSERGCRDRRAKVIPAARPVFDLGRGPGNRRLDALFDLVCVWHAS